MSGGPFELHRFNTLNYPIGYLATYMPRAHMRQAVVNRRIYRKHKLKPLWGIWTSVGYNYRRASSRRHRDSSNPPGFPCGIVVADVTDPSKGGQLVLEELNLILELHPGDVVIFPSALITHGNFSLITDQIRTSIAVWASGPVHIWADENCERRAESGPRPQRDPDDFLDTYSR